MISKEAIEAAARVIDAPSEPAAQEIARRALEAAAPRMLADAWGDGYLAGLADMQNGQERSNPYKSQP